MNRIPLTIQRRVVFLILVSIGLLVTVTPARAATSFGQPVPGKRVYDQAGVLTANEIDQLEEHARSVVGAGAPVIVYLQAKNASYDETYQDAVDLMNQWDVESAPGARDGLVLFFNLKPNDLHHGQVALYAGAKHYDGGNLPKSELQRIFSQVMRPVLKQGDLAQGIAEGLDATANSLHSGPPPPPPPSAAERLAADVSSGLFSPLNAVAVVVVAGFAWITRRVWQTRPRSIAPIAATTSPPDNTDPATVGAVVTGRVQDSQIEATILDLAHRGALVIESEGTRRAQVRLLDASIPKTEVERQLWESLDARADDQGVLSQANLGRVRSTWSGARHALEQGLVESGLFDPAANKRRRPVYIGCVVMLVLGIVALIVVAVGKQPWGMVGATLLLAASLGAFVWISSFPNTTQAGADLAAKWQSYIAGIRRAKSDPTLDVNLDLDAAMPYAVAAGVASSLNKRLKQAADEGYAPAWLGPALYRNGAAGDAFICWTAFHAAVTPASSGGSGGGGAAAGGGGAGGSF